MKRTITRISSVSYIPPTNVKILSSSKRQVKTFIYILILYLPFHTGDSRRDSGLKRSQHSKATIKISTRWDIWNAICCTPG